MSTLYELTSDYEYLLQLAEDPDTDPEVLSGTMEALQGEIEYKAEGYVVVMKELAAESEKFQAEIDRLNARKKSIDGNIERLKSALMSAMRIVGKDKVKTEHFKLSIAKRVESSSYSISSLPLSSFFSMLNLPFFNTGIMLQFTRFVILIRSRK